MFGNLMLLGQYEARVGEKNQVSLPKRFREELGESLIITKGLERCLIVVSEEKWRTLLEGTEGKPFTNKSVRELQRFLLGNASEIEIDAKGRFVLPEYLRNYANLKEDVTFVGVQRFVEIWDSKNWEEHQTELSGRIESVTERLSETGIE